MIETIYRNNSKSNTRVEFNKDNQGIILCFMKQDENRIIATKRYKRESSAIKWANEVL